LIRINAFLAGAGLGSRRSVEELIRSGKVSVNGMVIHDLAFRVDPTKDKVSFEEKIVRLRTHSYVMLNKPVGYACTRKDPHVAKTIYDLLPKELHHLTHVGRLDVDSEGLLLLSNDGDWVNKIAHPRNEIRKIYHLEVTGKVSCDALKSAIRGIQSQDELLKIETGKILKSGDRSTFLEVELRQGKNREIRRIFGALKHSVLSLRRVAIGKLELGSLKEGTWRKLDEKEAHQLAFEES
jgi:23S rRNA pseudouridine2605 synthase